MIDLDAMLAPISDAAPCGPDLAYDPAFVELEQVAQGKAEQQYGDVVIAAQDPDWNEVDRAAQALLGRTKDLRVVVRLARAQTRLHGFPGFARALELVRRLLDAHWDTLHPGLDVDDGNDATMRLNALAALAEPFGILRDLRAAPLSGTGGPAALRVRDLELGLRAAEPDAGETAPSEDGVLNGLKDLCEADVALGAALGAVAGHAAAIDAVITAHASASAAPDLGPLIALLKVLERAAARIGGDAAAAAQGATGADAPRGAPAGAGEIRTREDALRALDAVCLWLGRNEPTNPSPLLIRRAQRLMQKDFIEIIKDLVPSGLEQVLLVVGADETPQ